jgi:hypothetical protein
VLYCTVNLLTTTLFFNFSNPRIYLQYIFEEGLYNRSPPPPPPSCMLLNRLCCNPSQNFNTNFQCCGSGMLIPDPDFYPSRIPALGSRDADPKTATKERGEKNLLLKEKNLGQFSKNFITFYPTNCHQALKNMGLGSGIRDPRSGIQGSKRHRISDPDPQDCQFYNWPR